jgi:hypothetical protein
MLLQKITGAKSIDGGFIGSHLDRQHALPLWPAEYCNKDLWFSPWLEQVPRNVLLSHVSFAVRGSHAQAGGLIRIVLSCDTYRTIAIGRFATGNDGKQQCEKKAEVTHEQEHLTGVELKSGRLGPAPKPICTT